MKRSSRKHRLQRDESGADDAALPESAAEREVKVNHRKPNAAKALDRDVERTEVTATLAVLLRRSSIGALLSRKSDEGARGLDIKWLILAHVGVVAAINEVRLSWQEASEGISSSPLS
ncbi:hypothetical protein ATCC90586_011695 [Pythium insidiosum]|nr:hypothetical protein ATCC90586_011695 [Pythium insidiosum]